MNKREQMLAEAERLEQMAKALAAGEITPADTYEKSPYLKDPSERVPVPRDWSKSRQPHRQCKAHKKDGERCRQPAAIGQLVCKYHGAAAPQNVNKAKQRLQLAADRMAERLLGLAENTLTDGTKVGAYVQLGAVTAALDRAGIVPEQKMAVQVETPFDQLFGDLTGGSRAEHRRAVESARGLPTAPAAGIDAGPQAPELASQGTDRDRHREHLADSDGTGDYLDAEVIDADADQLGYDADDDDDGLTAQPVTYQRPEQRPDADRHAIDPPAFGPGLFGPLAPPRADGLIDAERATSAARRANAASRRARRR